MFEFGNFLCNDFVGKIINMTVCKGIVQLYHKIFLDTLVDKFFNPRLSCENMNACPKTRKFLNYQDFIAKIQPGKPADTKWPTPTKRDSYKVLHLTDIHIDQFYEIGSDAHCGQLICCRKESGAPKTPADAAGYWGSVGDCDIPVHTADQAFKWIKDNIYEDFDFIIFTGDMTDHAVWE